MLGLLKRSKSEKLKDQLAETDARLAMIKAQIAAELIKLAGQTSDLAPLEQAEAELSAARNHYTFETTPVEIGMVQVALGDMLVKLGRETSDKSAFDRAKNAYRAAVTLASLHGDDELRGKLREKLKMVESLMGKGPKTPSLFRAA